ncbi:MAG: phospholipase [Pseudomonadota bacterium]
MTMARLGPRTGARAGIVLAHGRGGTADDILGLIAAAGLSDVAAIAPQAPGQSWWPMSFLAPVAETGPFVERAIAAMTAGVAALQADGLTRDRIWLGGFSQGACLALETFARTGAGLAGVLALSGGLLGTSDAGGGPDAALYGHAPKVFDYPEGRDGARVWLSVHERDPHIPLQRVSDSVVVLRGLGARVETRVYPGAGHRVMTADLAVLKDWLGG